MDIPLPRQPSPMMMLVFTSAILLTGVGTVMILRQKGAWGMDPPDKRRKFHEVPIPRLGGLPIFVTLCLGYAFAAYWLPDFVGEWWPIMLTTTLIFAVGFADDLRPLGARVKLVGQVGAACILYALGISIDTLSNPFGPGHIPLGWWGFPITLMWLVAIPNVINLIDGMDGLATGFGLFLCLTLAFVGHFARMPDVVLISVVMSGALLGFLFFNLPPARIFLGDGGAYLIGFFVASVSLQSSNKGTIIASLLVMIIALGVPILDTFFAIVRRVIRGVPIFRADAQHMHHRLMVLGFSKARALVAMYTACLVLSLFGISLFWNRGLSLPIATAALALLGLGAARYLGYVKSWRDLRRQFQEAMARRRDMLYTSAYGKVLEWEAERCGDAAEFMTVFELGLGRVGLALRGEQEPEQEPVPEAGAGATSAVRKRPVELPLVGGLTCVLYVPDEPDLAERWHAKVDVLLPALNLATDRWGALPGMEWLGKDVPAPATATATATATEG
jgi:UDP-GlcNAc:undecaprenyl-phosphate GlcNAc-1-phosphate transferase